MKKRERTIVGVARALFAACAIDACSNGSSSEPLTGVDASDASVVSDTPADAHVRESSLGQPCVDQTDCDDGVFCNGVEECLGGFCVSPRNAACRDHAGCTSATCDESQGGCSIALSGGAAVCGSGTICRAGSGCEAVEGCTSESDPKCDDQRSCTRDSCDVATGACVHRPDDSLCPASVGACGVGVCFGVDVDGTTGCSAVPDASRCASSEGCDGTFTCVALRSSCTSDHDCTDHSLCDGVERCVDGKCLHGTRTRCGSPADAGACHHAECRDRSLGDPYCLDTALANCP